MTVLLTAQTTTEAKQEIVTICSWCHTSISGQPQANQDVNFGICLGCKEELLSDWHRRLRVRNS